MNEDSKVKTKVRKTIKNQACGLPLDLEIHRQHANHGTVPATSTSGGYLPLQHCQEKF
jgi:hypothetical protein